MLLLQAVLSAMPSCHALTLFNNFSLMQSSSKLDLLFNSGILPARKAIKIWNNLFFSSFIQENTALLSKVFYQLYLQGRGEHFHLLVYLAKTTIFKGINWKLQTLSRSLSEWKRPRYLSHHPLAGSWSQEPKVNYRKQLSNAGHLN